LVNITLNCHVVGFDIGLVGCNYAQFTVFIYLNTCIHSFIHTYTVYIQFSIEIRKSYVHRNMNPFLNESNDMHVKNTHPCNKAMAHVLG